MTEDAIEPPPTPDRIAALEARIVVLEQALAKAFGKYWLEEQGEKNAG